MAMMPQNDPLQATGSDADHPESTPSDTLLDALRAARRPLIVAHVTPDADAVGAMLALSTMLQQHGTHASIGIPTGFVAEKLRFMKELARDARIEPALTPPGSYDASFILDTAGEKRINATPEVDLSGMTPSLNIDHHVTNTRFATHNWVDPRASSTSELIARLAALLDWKVTPDVASLLYAGIYGDTLGFSLPTTTATTLHVAANLVRSGADVGRVGEELSRSQSPGDFELLRRVYDHTETIEQGRIAYSHLSLDEITKAGCNAEDIDDQVSIPRGLKGVEIALLFTEGQRGVIRVNLRGKGRTTVVEIAKQLGGGGHSQSAGIRFQDKSMDAAISAVIDAAREHLRRQDEHQA